MANTTLHSGAVKALNAWWLEHKPALSLPPTKGKSNAITTAEQARDMNLIDFVIDKRVGAPPPIPELSWARGTFRSLMWTEL
jgi:hypothetical protein